MFDALTYRLAAVVGTVVVLAMIAMTVFAALGEKAAKAQNKELRADLVTTNQAWGECKAERANAQAQVDEQTAQVRQWKAKAETVQREADAAVAKARREAAQYRKRADRLARIPTPAAGQCEAAAALYVETISEDVK